MSDDDPVESQSSATDAMPFPVVGIGASAGGLEAFQTFFASMPIDSGMAFVLIQHLNPHHESLIPELLARHTAMPVAAVEDETPVESNHVYVIPPNATMTIEGGILRVAAPTEARGSRTPIDAFFRSLADDQGTNAVCIILSGTGTDGTLGLRAVKEQGGMVIAQSAESAKYDSMLRSAMATGLVDDVLSAEDMPARLVEYARYLAQLHLAKGLEGIREEASAQLGRICATLRRRTGHDFSRYKSNTLTRRVQRRMQVMQVDSVEGYVELLAKDGEEAELLFKDLLIGVTDFFRDPDAFDALEARVVPELFRDKTREDSVRAWVTGCSSGEEAYSIAILLHEYAATLESPPTIQVFATDIDEEALDRARRGRYPSSSVEQIPARRLSRYFTKVGVDYEIAKGLREMCIFSSHNLIKDPPFSRLDLLSCRNLLIYMEADLQKQILPLFHYALATGGYLFLGPSEHVATKAELFHLLDKSQRIFKRRDSVTPSVAGFPLLEPPRGCGQGQRRLPPPMSTPRQDAVRAVERAVLESYAPPAVVVNADGDIEFFSGRTGRHLEPATGAASLNLFAMARRELRLDVRTVLHQAVQSHKERVVECLTSDGEDGPGRLRLIARPLAELGEQSDLYVVVFQELPATAERVGDEAGVADRDPELSRVLTLEHELRSTKEHLQATVEELETANEELKSSNEELLSMNEELQSSNEELQTSKEELQSVNEELETVNVELRTKVRELDEANGDLRNLFEGTRIATIFLDRDLRIKQFTPAATTIFRIRAGDLGRPITELASRVSGADVAREVENVLQDLTAREIEVRLAEEARNFILRILPYRTMHDVIDGVVLTFNEVTELRRSTDEVESLNRELKAQLADFAALFGMLPLPVLVADDPRGETLRVNRSARELLELGNDSAALDEKIAAADLPRFGSEDREQSFAQSPLGEAMASNTPVWRREIEFLRSDGQRVYLMANACPLTEADDAVSGGILTLTDITPTKVVALAATAENRQKDDFLSILGHELRNPLVPITNYVHMLDSADSDPEDRHRAAALMQGQVRHLRRLVDDLLDVARIGRGQLDLDLKPLDFRAVAQQIAETHRSQLEEMGLRVEVLVPRSPIWIRGDAVRLAQAIGNVLHNAGKFTPRGGLIRVSIWTFGQRARLEVNDTGRGISKELLPTVFEAFRQGERSAGGLGIGLSVARELVELHGGTIAVASDGVDCGVTMRLEFPTVVAPHPAPVDADESEVPKAPAKTSRRILLVEDSPQVAASMRMLLKFMGHLVVSAEDYESAMRELRDGEFDVLLCDLDLGAGPGGLEIARAIRDDVDIRCRHRVALSGFGGEADRAESEAAGFELHLSKPPDPEALTQLLAALPAKV